MDSSLDLAAALSPIVADSASALVPAALSRVLEVGHRVDDERPFFEVLSQTLCQRDPRRRVFCVPGSSFNPAVAVARWVWHLAGSSDLSAITFYEPRAARFSDDGTTLSGSNYGARMFGGNGGPNQVEGIVSRLRTQPASRRAMAVIWQPEDAIRQSQDIPCALAMACYVRNGQLLTTVSMRSNNALRLLPYNLFEFGMLAELVAAELKLSLGPYRHVANSLHVFEEEVEAAQRLASTELQEDPSMVPMPHDEPFVQAHKLVDHEQRLRTAFERQEASRLPRLVQEAEADLPPYWFKLYALLALFCEMKKEQVPELDPRQLLAQVPEPLHSPAARVFGLDS
jgi:hypothetical protein